MSLEKFWSCPVCSGDLFIKDSGQRFYCANCPRDIPIVGDVPVFYQGQKKSIHGLSEHLFQIPAMYRWYTRIKSSLIHDAKIGVRDYICGRNVLDAGCGPSMRNDYLEYNPDEALTFTGIDISMPFVLAARRENPGPKFRFAVTAVDRLPFADKVFDTSILSFVLHHLESNPRQLIGELCRVTRNHIILYDHIISNHRLVAFVQRLYLESLDGGRYFTHDQWHGHLEGLKIEKTLRTGVVFGHVIKYVCSVCT